MRFENTKNRFSQRFCYLPYLYLGKMASKRQIAQHVKLYNRVSVEYPMPWRTG